MCILSVFLKYTDKEVTYLPFVQFFVRACFKECTCNTVLHCYCWSYLHEQIMNGAFRRIMAVLSRFSLPVSCYSAVFGYGHIPAAP